VGRTNGAAGGAGGGNGGNASTNTTLWPMTYQRFWLANAGDCVDCYGGPGVAGANSGGGGGQFGSAVTLICGQIVGTDGIHTGVITTSAGASYGPTGNSTGAGGGGGAAPVALSSQGAVTTWPIVNMAGGPGGLTTVPFTAGVGGTCTSPPKATLGVSAGALSGTCTVVQAGAGCGTGANMRWPIIGGGGTQTTAAVVPTWSSGTLASCTVTPGDSAGYTATTYTNAGNGGDGAAGYPLEYSGW